MKLLPAIFLLLMPFSSLRSEMHHHFINNQNITNDSYCWIERNVSPFEELLISWNATRPDCGHYSIYISINTGRWSPWLLYAQWGSSFQKGNISSQKKASVRVYQDAVETLKEKTGKGFKIKVTAENGANISSLKSIHVCATNFNKENSSPKTFKADTSYLLDVDGLSQMALIDERRNRLCSPTSTTAVIRFLKKETTLDPIQFAENVWDASFDIFGTWVFNVAEAYNQINNQSYSCWVERLDSFQNILDSLKEGFPVVISVRGPLPNSAQAYKSGHLLVVIGFDAKTKEVICMDPAFDTDNQTRVRYPLEDLTKAWKRRKNVSYIFKK